MRYGSKIRPENIVGRASRSPSILLVGLLIIPLLLLTGCPPAKKGGEISLKYMQWGDPQEVKIAETLIKAFEQQNPNIKIQIIHANDYLSKLNIMIAGGTPPDVFYVNNDDFPNKVRKGVLLDLEPYVKRDAAEVNVEDFFPLVLNYFRFQGDLYGIPKDFTPMVLYYNKDMFDEDKVPYPDDTWDWDKLLENSKKLTHEQGKKGFKQYGILAGSGWEIFVYQNNGKILSDDGKTCLLNQPEAYEAIQFFSDLKSKYKVAPSSQESKDSPVRLNVGGSAMEYAGRWVVPLFRKITRFKWDVAPLFHGKKRATPLYPVAYGIAAASAHKEEAWKLVKFLTGKQGQDLNVGLGLALPSRRSIANSPAFFDPTKPPEHNGVYLDVLKYGFILPYNAQWNEIRSKIESRLELVFQGDRPAKDACEEATIEVNKILRGAENAEPTPRPSAGEQQGNT